MFTCHMGTIFHLHEWFIDWLGYTGAFPPFEKGTEDLPTFHFSFGCSPECVAGTQHCWLELFRIKFRNPRGVHNLWPLPATFFWIVGFASFAPRKNYWVPSVGKWRLFGSASCTAEVLKIYNDRFSGVFFLILFKTCVWTESNSVLSIVLGTEWHSTICQPHKSEKYPSVADNCLQLQARAFFNDFLLFQLFFENYSSGLFECWKRDIGLKIDHAITRTVSYTTKTINENSDHWARFRSGRDVPYHRVSIDTIFHMQSKTLVHCAELSSSLFSATVHQMTLIRIVQGNVIPTFQ